MVTLASRPGQSCVIFTKQRVKKCETQISPHFFQSFLQVADALSEFLGLRGNGTADVQNRRDRQLQQDAVKVAGLRSVRSVCGHSIPKRLGKKSQLFCLVLNIHCFQVFLVGLFRGIKKPLNHWRFGLGMVSPFEVSPGKTCAISRRPNAFLLS